MSKEQALAEYLKKSAEPTYCSKVLGGGIIFKKAQSKDSWKKRTYYIKDDKKTVAQILSDAVLTIGENIKVRRFERFVLGEGLEKKNEDFAAEVAAASAGM